VPNPSITARLSVASATCATLTGPPQGNDTQRGESDSDVSVLLAKGDGVP
jgi:hypothetical protein